MAAARKHFALLVFLPLLILLHGSTWRLGQELDQRWLLPLLFGAALLLCWGRRREGAAGRLAARGVELLERADVYLAAPLVYLVIFRAPESLLIPVVLFAAIVVLLTILGRASGPWLLSLVVAYLAFGQVLPRAFQALMIARIAASHDLSVDHRLRPDGGEINSDGARFRGEASDLADDDFVVLFLGDSFTFGYGLPYERAYPYQLEVLARRRWCHTIVKAVDFGWTSSSPLLGLRLLREVGYRYRPDLIVYSLDMTDFHDDLRYEKELRERRDFEFDGSAFAERLVMTEAPWAEGLLPAFRTLTDRLRASAKADRAGLLAGLEIPAPGERYFITQYPLEKTRPAIELGVMKNLAEMHDFARDVLGAPMALVVYPRTYQYSQRESPRNWEANSYEGHERYAREPFRYFEEVSPSLPYPVLDLFRDFEQSGRFPLHFPNDPHWNKDGAALVARAVYDRLSAAGLIPCEALR